MDLIDHVSVTVSDLGRARPFYDAIMAALGAETAIQNEKKLGYGKRNRPDDFSNSYFTVYQSTRPVSTERKRHCSFKAQSREQVDRFYTDGLKAGGGADHGPKLFAEYHPSYYAAFLLDPEGNRLEAVCHKNPS